MSPVISVPFGKYSRMSPLAFSFVPRSHGECAKSAYGHPEKLNSQSSTASPSPAWQAKTGTFSGQSGNHPVQLTGFPHWLGHRNSERSHLDKLDDQRFYVRYPAVQLNGGGRKLVGVVVTSAGERGVGEGDLAGYLLVQVGGQAGEP